tara:strand:+ start:300 stop:518 length:219 start_codon:yes stop_codon:yes gene_type:complete
MLSHWYIDGELVTIKGYEGTIFKVIISATGRQPLKFLDMSNRDNHLDTNNTIFLDITAATIEEIVKWRQKHV